MVFRDLYDNATASVKEGFKYLVTPTKYTKAGQDIRFRDMNGPLYSASVEDLVILSHEENPLDLDPIPLDKNAPKITITEAPNTGIKSRRVAEQTIYLTSTHDAAGKPRSGLTVPIIKAVYNVMKHTDNEDVQKGMPGTPVLEGEEGKEMPELELPGPALQAQKE